ncbi:MAG: transposase [Promethearchaeota archaeon]
MADPCKAADYFRDQRWPTGVQCPRCGATDSAIEALSRCANGVHRYSCQRCAREQGQAFATFTDRTATIFEGGKLVHAGRNPSLVMCSLGIARSPTLRGETDTLDKDLTIPLELKTGGLFPPSCTSAR